MPVRDSWHGLRSLAAVSLLEMRRQHLWLLAVVPALALAIVVPNLQAVDQGDQLRLGVMTTLSSMGFVATLLGILVAAGLQTRDREQHIDLMLFSKPLGYGSYMGGRWVGIAVATFIALAVMAIGGGLGLLFGLGRLPAVRTVATPVAWTAFDALREERVVHGNRIQLSGIAGDGIRWHFTGIDPSAGEADLLLRARVSHQQPGWPLRRAKVAVTVYPEGQPERATAALVDPDSPYGLVQDEQGATVAGAALLTDRSRSRDDLEDDYLRLDLRPEQLAPSLVVELTRLEQQAVIGFVRDGGAYISRPAGGFALNMLQATLALTAQAAMLAAVAGLVACVSNLGVCLLAGLTVYFAGHSLGLIDELLRRGEHHVVVGRFFELVRLIIPDLQFLRLPEHLAGGHAVGWARVADAWLYYGSYSMVMIVASWLVLRRRAR